MSNNLKFHVAYTVTTDASAHDIWALWADVNNWSKWDHGIAHSEIRDSFKVGNRFSLTPQGGDPLEITLKTVTQGEEFSDEAVLPFGTIRNVHHMQAVGKNFRLRMKSMQTSTKSLPVSSARRSGRTCKPVCRKL